MRLPRVGFVALSLFACSCRDVTLPPLPGAGSIQGTVAYASEGRATARAAGGATVELTRAGGAATTASADGYFHFEGVETDEGSIVFRYRDASSGLDFQKSLTLRGIGAGFGRHVQLGQVVLGPSATVVGTVLRGDVAGPTGHAGTLVFVPEGPALTQTADDGSFVLANLPEGAVSLSMFREGYVSQSIDGVLRAGEEFRLRTVTLSRQTGAPVPATVTGRVTLLGADDPSGVSVVAVSTATTRTTTSDADGAFSLSELPEGLYNLALSKPGFRAVTLRNILAHGEVNLGVITLGPGDAQAQDAGAPPAPDAGPPPDDDAGVRGDAGVALDAGADGGQPGDAGAPDAGEPDAGLADAGEGDAGAADAGPTDAGPIDAGPRDAGFVFFSDGGLVIVSGDGQHARPQEVLSATVTIELRAGLTPIANVTVGAVSLPPGVVLLPTTATTNSLGRASFDVLAPRDLGTHAVVLQNVDGGGTQAMLTLTVDRPDAGLVSTSVNLDHQAGASLGPGTLARTSGPYGVVVASDGTVYFSDSSNNQVKKLSAQGEVSLVAGTGAGGASGDTGPAVDAQLWYPLGLALDEPGQRLYIADSYNSVVRVVDLATGLIDLVAGGGAATSPGFGDNGSLLNAVFSGPSMVTFRRESGASVLYVYDAGHGRFRRLDLAANRVTAYLMTSGPTPSSRVSCAGYSSCQLIFDAQGGAFVSGYVGSALGVFRFGVDGGVTLVAGKASGATGDGIAAVSARVSTPSPLALDSAGNLFYGDTTDHVVRRVEAGTGRVRTVAGTGMYGSGDEYAPGTSAALYLPSGLGATPSGDLVIVDQYNHSLRTVWGVANQSSPPPVLKAVDAGVPTTGLFQAPAVSFEVVLTDAAQQPLSGYPIEWGITRLGSALLAGTSTTDATGRSFATLRAGLLPGQYDFTARYTDGFSPVLPSLTRTFSIIATAPPVNTVFTLIGKARLGGDEGFGGPGPDAHVSGPWALAVANDGTVFVAPYSGSRVRVLRPSGVYEALAGTGTAGYAGDNGPADEAQLSSAQGLAFDEVSRMLYVADTYNHVIRRIDLTVTPPRIETFAGVHDSEAPLNDGFAPLLAGLSSPTFMRVHTEGAARYLYVADSGHSRIVKLTIVGAASVATTAFSPALGPAASATVSPTASMCNNGAVPGCSFDFDPQGNMLIAGLVYGGPNQTSARNAVVRWLQGPNTFELIAGSATTNTASGVPATDASFVNAPMISVDATGAIALADYAGQVVRRIDPTGVITTLVGDGTAGFSGEYVPASDQLRAYGPAFAALSAGHVYFSDYSNNSVRVVW